MKKEPPGGTGLRLGALPVPGKLSSCSSSESRNVLLPLLIDQLSGQLDDHSSRPDHEACSQLLSNILEVLDRKDVVSSITDRNPSSSLLALQIGSRSLL